MFEEGVRAAGPRSVFIDYWNGFFSRPVTTATTCVKQKPHIPVYGKIIIVGMSGTRTTDVD